MGLDQLGRYCVFDAGILAVTVKIGEEPFNLAIAAEILPLAQACWEESTVYKKETCAYYGDREFAVEPDTERYQTLADQGIVTLMTIRDDARMCGYILAFTYQSMHHKKIPCGIGDSAYIEPKYRSYTGVLIDKFEAAMKERDVQIIGWPTHIDGPLYEVLKARGYVGDDIVMEKRI